jgi:hypothetical protein
MVNFFFKYLIMMGKIGIDYHTILKFPDEISCKYDIRFMR